MRFYCLFCSIIILFGHTAFAEQNLPDYVVNKEEAREYSYYKNYGIDDKKHQEYIDDYKVSQITATEISLSTGNITICTEGSFLTHNSAYARPSYIKIKEDAAGVLEKGSIYLTIDEGTLLKEMNKNLYLNHEYIKLKAKLLGKEKINMYDAYVNTLDAEEKYIEYEEAKNIVLDALSIMGEEYISILKKAFNNNWLDVYEKDNKMSGAYSMGVHTVHPFVLLNYINSSRDVSTIAHELGHSMHSYYASKNQNIINANYTIMVAEVASTVNEIILANYLIDKETDKMKKAALINEQLDMIRATLIRQAMFAEFEKDVHSKIELGESLTSDNLNNIYFDLVKKYFGENAIINEEIKYEWARIPHFYRCFYVYKYSTGITSAIVIANKILSKEPGYVEKYINMLSMGGSKDSLSLLRSVDVDLEKEETYEDAFKYFENKLNEMKALID